jgi:anti-sigma-K factor RskA
MYDDAQDAVAAEYVLGTLSADEREHAEALLAIDPGFAEAVRVWERRLGELNVMVDAVEPPPEVWDKIKAEIGDAAPGRASAAAGFAAATSDQQAEMEEALSQVAALASSLSPPTADQLAEPATESTTVSLAEPSAEHSPPPAESKVERSADVVYLARRVHHWRRMTVAAAAIAAVLAIFVAVNQFAPGVIPLGRFSPSQLMARSQGPTPLEARLVAVLQQEPTAPAFLLTVDPKNRTLIVRRVSATPEPGRSYELWLISSRFPTPRSLGVVGNDEFTQRAIPGNFDVDTIRGASYAVSLEPDGGSHSGVPTGPILFTGKMVESVPASPPPSPRT